MSETKAKRGRPRAADRPVLTVEALAHANHLLAELHQLWKQQDSFLRMAGDQVLIVVQVGDQALTLPVMAVAAALQARADHCAGALRNMGIVPPARPDPMAPPLLEAPPAVAPEVVRHV
jgi:hypothetical protein